MRKAILLTRYVNLMRHFLRDERADANREAEVMLSFISIFLFLFSFFFLCP